MDATLQKVRLKCTNFISLIILSNVGLWSDAPIENKQQCETPTTMTISRKRYFTSYILNTLSFEVFTTIMSLIG